MTQFFLQCRFDSLYRGFPAAVEHLDSQFRAFKQGGPTYSSQPIAEESWPGTLETGNYPFAVFGCPAAKQKKNAEQLLQVTAPGKGPAVPKKETSANDPTSLPGQRSADRIAPECWPSDAADSPGTVGSKSDRHEFVEPT